MTAMVLSSLLLVLSGAALWPYSITERNYFYLPYYDRFTPDYLNGRAPFYYPAAEADRAFAVSVSVCGLLLAVSGLAPAAGLSAYVRQLPVFLAPAWMAHRYFCLHRLNRYTPGVSCARCVPSAVTNHGRPSPSGSRPFWRRCFWRFCRPDAVRRSFRPSMPVRPSCRAAAPVAVGTVCAPAVWLYWLSARRRRFPCRVSECPEWAYGHWACRFLRRSNTCCVSAGPLAVIVRTTGVRTSTGHGRPRSGAGSTGSCGFSPVPGAVRAAVPAGVSWSSRSLTNRRQPYATPPMRS